jgi:hypothetical protein
MTTYSTFEQTPIATNYADFQHTMFILFPSLGDGINPHYWDVWHMNYDAPRTERDWHEFLYNIAMENI